jgi:transcriptional regulator with XRE-family HTH domain
MILSASVALPVVEGSLHTSNTVQGTHLVKESLPDYVRRIRNEHRLSLLDVEAASRRAGWKIAGSYVSRIENGVARNPSIDKLIGLAYGMGVPLEELLAIATGKDLQSGDAEQIRLAVMFRELPEERRADVIRFVRMMHQQYASELSAPGKSPPTKPIRDAARASKRR